MLNSLNQPAQDPPGLSRAQFNADPRQTAPQAVQYDTCENLWQSQGGVQWEHRFDGLGPLQRSAVMLYGGRRSLGLWQAKPVSSQASATSP